MANDLKELLNGLSEKSNENDNIEDTDNDLDNPEVQDDDLDTPDDSSTDEDELENSEDVPEDDLEDDIEDGEEKPNLFNELNKLLGLELEVEDIADNQSVEGVAKYITDKYGKSLQESIYTSIQKEHPDIYNLLDIAYKGGDVYNTMSNIVSAYNETGEIDLKENDEVLSEKLVREEMQRGGWFTEDEINDKIGKMKDEGDLYDKAKTIAEKRNNEFTEKNQLAIQKEKQKLQLKQERFDKNIDRLQEHIDKGVAGKLKIPNSDKDKFLKYIATGLENQKIVPNDNGDLVVLTPLDENGLESLFYEYRGGNISDIVEAKAATRSVQDYLKRNKVSKGKKRNTKQGNYDNPSTIIELAQQIANSNKRKK